jgi:hypothetical protein
LFTDDEEENNDDLYGDLSRSVDNLTLAESPVSSPNKSLSNSQGYDPSITTTHSRGREGSSVAPILLQRRVIRTNSALTGRPLLRPKEHLALFFALRWDRVT